MQGITLDMELNTCEWFLDESVWQTDCDNLFQFSSGSPTENSFKFCPYCGKVVVELPDETIEDQA